MFRKITINLRLLKPLSGLGHQVVVNLELKPKVKWVLNVFTSILNTSFNTASLPTVFPLDYLDFSVSMEKLLPNRCVCRLKLFTRQDEMVRLFVSPPNPGIYNEINYDVYIIAFKCHSAATAQLIALFNRAVIM